MQFDDLARTCAPEVALATLTAVVRAESRFRPNAINVNGAQLKWQPRTRKEAEITAAWLIRRGYNVDLGLGQINSANLSRLGMTIEDAFNPCENLRATAHILATNFQAAKTAGLDGKNALLGALSAYNTGNFQSGYANGYLSRIRHASAAALPPASAKAGVPSGRSPTAP